MKVKFVAEEKYQPRYANSTDACMDLKAKIDSTTKNVQQDEEGFYVDIPSGETAVLGTGVQSAVPEGYVMTAFVRSSTGIKRNLVLANGTGIIDSGYRDEIKLALHNIGKNVERVRDGERLAQFMILPFPKIEPEFVQDNDEFRQGDREGGIGSTGR